MSRQFLSIYTTKPIPVREFLDKLTYYFNLESLDGKTERQKLRAELKEIIAKSVVLDIEKPEPF